MAMRSNNPEDLRPSVVIGVGGSGRLVVTYLKERLLEEFTEDAIEKRVRFIAMDSDQQEGEENTTLGGTELDYSDSSTEFTLIEGIVADPINAIKDRPEGSDFPYIREWLPYEDADRHDLPAGMTSIGDIGANQRRQLSRIALFLNPIDFIKEIKDAMTEVDSHIGGNQQIRCYLIASMGGGTGSGLIMDIAAMINHFSLQTLHYHKPVSVNGFFFLPDTFKKALLENYPNQFERVHANSFACWKEIHRHFARSSFFFQYDGNLKFPVQFKLFDFIYLLDGSRVEKSEAIDLSNFKPKVGLCPAVADFLMLHIDNSINLWTALANHMGDIHENYSTFGIHNLIFPKNDILEEFSLKMILDLYDALLDDEYDIKRDEKGALWTEMDDHLQEELINNGNTSLLLDLYTMSERDYRLKGNLLRTMLQYDEDNKPLPENRSFEEIDVSGFLGFGKIEDEHIKGVSENISSNYLGEDGTDDLETVRGNAGYLRALHLVHNENFILELLGKEIEDEESLLMVSGEKHRKKKRKSEYTGILNEEDKRGKIYKAKGVLTLFMEVVENFERRLKAAYKKRAGSGGGHYLKKARDSAERALNDMKEAGTFTKGAEQKDYLEEMERLTNHEAFDIYYKTLLQITEDLKSLIKSYLESINSWITDLENVRSLISEMLEGFMETRSKKAEVKVRTYICGPEDEYERKLYDEYADDEIITSLLNILSWKEGIDEDLIGLSVERDVKNDGVGEKEEDEKLTFEEWLTVLIFHTSKRLEGILKIDIWKALSEIDSDADKWMNIILKERDLLCGHTPIGETREEITNITDEDKTLSKFRYHSRNEPGRISKEFRDNNATGDDIDIKKDKKYDDRICSFVTRHYVRPEEFYTYEHSRDKYKKWITSTSSEPIHVFAQERNAIHFLNILKETPSLNEFLPDMERLETFQADVVQALGNIPYVKVFARVVFFNLFKIITPPGEDAKIAIDEVTIDGTKHSDYPLSESKSLLRVLYQLTRHTEDEELLAVRESILKTVNELEKKARKKDKSKFIDELKSRAQKEDIIGFEIEEKEDIIKTDLENIIRATLWELAKDIESM